jgi:acetyl-CoA synthetase
MNGLDWSSVQTFSSTGECSNSQDMEWLMRFAGGKPVIEYCGGTEIGGGFISSTVVQPNVPAAFSTPTLGSDFILLDEDDQPADVGELFLIPPAIGMSRRILNGEHDRVYFDGVPLGPNGQVLRRHGDRFARLPDGYFRALGRADDTMNLGGIKVGAAEIERAIDGVVEGVTEAAAIAVHPTEGGPARLIVFVVVSQPPPDAVELKQRIQHAIDQRLNPLFKVHDLITLDALPRTASQKVMRRELRKWYEDFSVAASLTAGRT